MFPTETLGLFAVSRLGLSHGTIRGKEKQIDNYINWYLFHLLVYWSHLYNSSLSILKLESMLVHTVHSFLAKWIEWIALIRQKDVGPYANMTFTSSTEKSWLAILHDMQRANNKIHELQTN